MCKLPNIMTSETKFLRFIFFIQAGITNDPAKRIHPQRYLNGLLEAH